jgi:hypothetical protein
VRLQLGWVNHSVLGLHSIQREEREVKEHEDGSGTMTSHPLRSDEFGPWPLNVVGRQWRKGKGLGGWRRLMVVLAIGAEVLLIVAVVALLII